MLHLLDVAPAADFSRSARVYFSLVREAAHAYALEVWSARLARDALADARREYRARAASPLPPALISGRLFVLGPGEFIVSIADFDDRHSRAQESDSHWGKLVRVREGAEPETIARGVRNVQGIARDLRGVIWFTDHGPRGGDELNVLRADANYGWPLSSAGRHYDGTPLPAHAQRHLEVAAPLLEWTPALAPSSLLIYAGREFPEWEGSFLVASLAQRHLRRLEVRRGRSVREEILLGELGERIRDVRADSAGRLHVLTDGPDARVLRLSRARPATLHACSRSAGT